MGGKAVRGQLVHIGVDMNDGVLAGVPSAQRPMHGVALVEPGAERDQHIRRLPEEGGGSVAGARITEDAERQVVILREDALGAQRRCDRNRPALGNGPQRDGRVIVLDAGAGEKRDPRPGRLAQQVRAPLARQAGSGAQPHEIIGDRRVIRRALAGHPVVRHRQCTGPRGCAHIAVSACRSQ